MGSSSLHLDDPESFTLDDRGRSPAYFSKKAVMKVDAHLISELKEASSKFDGSNVRICLHDSPDADFHEMINLEHKGKYYRPHKHPTKGESYHIIEGSTAFFVFDESGDVTDTNILDSNKSFIYRVSLDMYHALVPLSDILIYHESKLGPFIRGLDSIFPVWAPDGEDLQEVQAYTKELLANIQGR